MKTLPLTQGNILKSLLTFAVPVLLAEEIIVPSAYWTNLVLLYVFMLGGAVPTIRSSIRNRRFVDVVYRLGHPPVEL